MDYLNLVKKFLTNDLRNSEWKGNPNPLAGHCYVASEALYHLLGGKQAGWKPMYVKHEGFSHWFLMNDKGDILDATIEQFKTPVPIEKAKGKGFLTKGPSRRAQIVINRVCERALTTAV